MAAPDTGAEAPVDPELAKDVLRLAHELRGELETSANLRRDLEMLEVGYKSLQGALERKSEEMDDLKKLNLGLQVRLSALQLSALRVSLTGDVKTNRRRSSPFPSSSSNAPYPATDQRSSPARTRRPPTSPLSRDPSAVFDHPPLTLRRLPPPSPLKGGLFGP